MRKDVAHRPLRIGAGAGYSGDRIEPAVELVENAELDFLVFECLAERTIALAHQMRRSGESAGFDPYLADRLRAVVPGCRSHGTRIVTNSGAANPAAAARLALSVAQELGWHDVRVAAVTGDDVLDAFRTPGAAGGKLVSANAYLGAQGIVEALDAGADIVITGRTTDAALFLGPLVHHHRWEANDWDRLAAGVVAGHLLECAGQLTGGYFADPITDPVPGMARLGFPYADVSADGTAIFSKVDVAGGRLDRMTTTLQLLYEVSDPGAYLTPDVTVDLREVTITEVGHDRVSVAGARGAPPPTTLKVLLGHEGDFIGEGQISYAGPGARERAELAAEVVAERLAATGNRYDDLRVELIGTYGLGDVEVPEVRLRIAGRTPDRGAAGRIGREVEALYTNGPAGGGGARGAVTPVLEVSPTFVDADTVRARVEIVHP